LSRKLITTSDGIDRKRQKSKNWKAKKHYLKAEINRVLKQLIDGSFSPVLENLKNLKKGKGEEWARDINRRFNHWTYSYVFTSTTCPECGLRFASPTVKNPSLA